MNLPEDILEALRSGRIAYTKAHAIARLKDKKETGSRVTGDTHARSLLSIIRSRVRTHFASQATPTHLALPSRASVLARKLRRRKVLKDEKKRELLETLLAEMESLLEG